MSEQLSSENDSEQKRPKDRYMQIFPLARLAIRATHAITVEGKENILDEPTLYAANHERFIDSLGISMVVTEKTHRPMRFIIKDDYIRGLGLDGQGKLGRTTKLFMRNTWQIPVNRENEDPASVLRMIRDVKEVKARGEDLGIHPSGTRTDNSDGLPEFHIGVGAIATNAKEPVVPTTVSYKPRPHWYSRIPMSIGFGAPIMPEEFASLPDPDTPGEKAPVHLTGTESVIRVTRTVETRVADMLGIARTGVKAKLGKYRKQK